jgi:hypothetical protein
MSTFDGSNLTTKARRQWVSPAVKLVGTIAEVLKGGGGKMSVIGGDPGEHRKQTGTSG